MDHSRIQPNGYYGIMFYIKNMDDFWKRLYSRSTWEFTRSDVQVKKENMEKQLASIKNKIDIGKKIKKGNWIDRLLFRLRKKIGLYLTKKYGY